MIWTDIEGIFLETIPGVLALGAAGSLLAMAGLWLVRKVVGWYASNYGLNHAVRATYPYVRAMVKAKELRNHLIDQGDTHDYHICAVEAAIIMAVSIGISSLLLMSTVFAFLVLWPEYPYALAFLVCGTLFWIHSTLLDGIAYLTFLPEHLKRKRDFLDKKYKRFKDFERLTHERIDAELAEEARRAMEEQKAQELSVKFETQQDQDD